MLRKNTFCLWINNQFVDALRVGDLPAINIQAWRPVVGFWQLPRRTS
ncbi:hypothetical protein J2Y86_003817 [Pseudomonas migulae]|nr:hypothetical protein [Pseudomonas migulae]